MHYAEFNPRQPKVVPSKLYSVPRTARLLGPPGMPISRKTVYRWIRLKALVAITPPKGRRAVPGREIIRFWNMATIAIIDGSYPMWKSARQRPKEKEASRPRQLELFAGIDKIKDFG